MNTGDVCIPNINKKERLRRLKSGAVTFGLCLVILLALLAARANPWWRLALAPLWMAAAAGYFQWSGKT